MIKSTSLAVILVCSIALYGASRATKSKAIGCAIAVFFDDLSNEITAFTKEARRSASKIERIEDQEVSVFQEKLERDTWTTFVAFPNEHVIFAATDRNYLVEMLMRLRGNNGQRALPK